MLQSVFIVLYEGGITPLHLRVLLLLWLSSFLKACSMEASPVETICVFIVALWPLFDLADTSMKSSAESMQARAIEMDELGSGEVLPFSRPSESQYRPKRDFKGKHYVPSLMTSMTSVCFMVYLLYRKHEITPDLFHFVTCLYEDH